MENCIKFIPDHSINLNIRKSSSCKQFPEHTHDCTELAIVLKGSATHIIDGVPHFAKAGDVYVIKPGVSHGFEDTRSFEHYVFSYMPDMLETLGSDIRGTAGFQTLLAIGHRKGGGEFDAMLSLSLDALAQVEAIVESAMKELSQGRPGCESLAKAKFMEIAVFLSRKREEQEPKAGTPLDVERAAKLASRLEARYKEPPELPLAAKELGLSERQLRRVFKKHYSMAPMDYLMRVRTGHAMELLDSSDMSLAEIACACGFSDSNYLSRQFKKATGIPPSEWRRSRTPLQR